MANRIGKILLPTYYKLLVAKDPTKDQSYFLWTLTQEQLRHCLFPVGDLIKRTEVRKLAKKFGLENAEKKDSQGICFLGQISIADFLKDYIKPKSGMVVNMAGEEIGTHKGAAFYTIGQRHGFDVRIRKRELGIRGDRKPYYVVSKDVKKNILVVAEGEKNESLYKKEVNLANANFINPFIIHNSKPAHPTGEFIIPVMARVRYRQPLEKAKLLWANSHELAHNRTWKLVFEKPVKFVAIGQSAVFYDKKGEMLGGGIIKETS
jgi:tRNA-specific 2-thiouridylase